ncbi:hypothetical protein TD95_003526 [Thielaviopsis punctulata]|uniref:RING-type E3 ubiquitin transferase n=1 Tax=Thielaviopsis punctulata TaxID=72032 RepID=A0A0F4ZG39_9PEZI|nr:hypothetical protein TD95_003526 [Thielaviopsis punctulata]
MRLAAYITGSTVLAAGVFVSAFQLQANFYSAMVYLSQSNFCLLVLVNFVFIIYASIMHGLRHLCFGPLRTVEVEQLSERAWIAITETCLAMTIFREEIGAYFITMFTALVTGKVWSWIGEGRVETFEQQPPTNPRLFHTRLVISLAISLFYDLALFKYAAGVVIQQVRPTMMIMFLFEFAVLTMATSHTIVRYIFNILETFIVKNQTRKRLEERRNEVRRERERILKEREENPPAEDAVLDDLPDPEDIEEMDIEVPGWEEKGQYMLTVDLISDFVKLAIYVAFFVMLFSFYGLPVHILRDIYLTGASFFRRVAAMLKYRRAMQNMNQYADATADDLAREDTCIICRDIMRPWNPNSPGAVERTRPKKLPCGHILHYGCLKSWLERQQVCPTCRRPVSNAAPTNNDAINNNNNNQGAGMPRFGLNAPAGNDANPAAPNRAGDDAPGAAAGQPGLGGEPVGLREFQLGPLRLRFGARRIIDEQQANVAQQGFFNNGNLPPNNLFNNAPNHAPGAVPAPIQLPQNDLFGNPQQHGNAGTNGQPTPTSPLPHTPVMGLPYNPYLNTTAPPMTPQIPPLGDLNSIRSQVRQINEILSSHVASLQSIQQDMHVNNLLLQEINRLQAQTSSPVSSTAATAGPSTLNPFAPSASAQSFLNPGSSSAGPSCQASTTPLRSAIPAGSPDLPAGLVLPSGWSLVPVAGSSAGAQTAGSTASSTAPSVRSVSRSRSPVRSRSLLAALRQSSSFNNLHNTTTASTTTTTTTTGSGLGVSVGTTSAAGSTVAEPVVAPSPLSVGAASSLLHPGSQTRTETEPDETEAKGKAVTVMDVEDEETTGQQQQHINE